VLYKCMILTYLLTYLWNFYCWPPDFQNWQFTWTTRSNVHQNRLVRLQYAVFTFGNIGTDGRTNRQFKNIMPPLASLRHKNYLHDYEEKLKPSVKESPQHHRYVSCHYYLWTRHPFWPPTTHLPSVTSTDPTAATLSCSWDFADSAKQSHKGNVPVERNPK